MINRQSGQLFNSRLVKRSAPIHESACSPVGHGFKDSIEIAVAARMQDMELHSKVAGRCLRVSGYGLGSGGGWVGHEQSNL